MDCVRARSDPVRAAAPEAANRNRAAALRVLSPAVGWRYHPAAGAIVDDPDPRGSRGPVSWCHETVRTLLYCHGSPGCLTPLPAPGPNRHGCAPPALSVAGEPESFDDNRTWVFPGQEWARYG